VMQNLTIDPAGAPVGVQLGRREKWAHRFRPLARRVFVRAGRFQMTDKIPNFLGDGRVAVTQLDEIKCLVGFARCDGGMKGSLDFVELRVSHAVSR